jgi:tetratricopeptide (TPR) repeat protein
VDWEVDYLKGKHFLNRREPKAVQQAIAFFTSAATKRQAFSMAMAGLAECYATLAWMEFNAPEPVWCQAILCARRALGETPPFKQALTTLAAESALHRWDWTNAERLFQEAISADSTWIPAYQMYAMFCLAPQGRLEEALLYLQRALEIQPNSSVSACYLGRIFYFQRDYTHALRELDHSIRLNPKLLPAYWALGFTYAQLERWDDAVASLSACLDMVKQPATTAELGYIQGLSGHHHAALYARSSLTELHHSTYVSPISLALIEIGLGDTDAAFNHLHSAVNSRAPRIVYLPVDPAFDRIKTDPRFVRILSRLGL